MKIENMFQSFSCISFLFKPPWFIHKNWKQTFERKLVYTPGITVQDMVLDSYFLQIASLIFSGVFNVFDIAPLPSVSVANFEHFFVSWVCCEQRYMTANCCSAEMKPHLKLLLKLPYHWYLPMILLKL